MMFLRDTRLRRAGGLAWWWYLLSGASLERYEVTGHDGHPAPVILRIELCTCPRGCQSQIATGMAAFRWV